MEQTKMLYFYRKALSAFDIQSTSRKREESRYKILLSVNSVKSHTRTEQVLNLKIIYRLIKLEDVVGNPLEIFQIFDVKYFVWRESFKIWTAKFEMKSEKCKIGFEKWKRTFLAAMYFTDVCALSPSKVENILFSNSDLTLRTTWVRDWDCQII